MKEFYNLFLFAALCLVIFILFRSFNYNPIIKEGMTDASGNTIAAPENGIAGNAAAYAASIKAATIKMQDTLLIDKYRSDYETAILNLDDFFNVQMLNIALSINPDKPNPMLIQTMGTYQQAKLGLNSIMKYIDSQ